MLTEASDFASGEVSRSRISPEMSIYSSVLVATHTYPYLANLLGTGKTVKSYKYEKTA